jgi:hypothetical protein
MCSRHIQGQDIRQIEDDVSTMQMILPLDAISHSTAKRPAMAVPASIAAVAVVLSSTGICNYGNQMI